jgi:hypothetical protein
MAQFWPVKMWRRAAKGAPYAKSLHTVAIEQDGCNILAFPKQRNELPPREEFLAKKEISVKMSAPRFAAPVRLLALPISFIIAMTLAGCQSTNESFATWNQNNSAQWLIPLSEGFCYTTRISGDFASDKEAVYVRVFTFPNSAATPTWQVGGASSTKDVSITAGCSAFASFNMKDYSWQGLRWVNAAPVFVAGTPATVMPTSDCCPILEYCEETHQPTSPLCSYSGGTNGHWQTGDNTTPLLSTNSFCSLNGIGGGLNGSESAAVQPVASPNLGLFQLQVVAPTPNDTVSAAASCVSFSPLSVSNYRLTKIYFW